MSFPLKSNFRVTADFYEKRPLYAEPKTHIHGAVDLAVPIGTSLYAPEEGYLYYFAAFRNNSSRNWLVYWPNRSVFPFSNYFYDTFGAIIVLVSIDGKTHVFAHAFFNQVFNRGVLDKSAFSYYEEPSKEQFPLFCFHTLEHARRVIEGEMIGYTGDAGQSEGPHVHWEIHHGLGWDAWQDRINPFDLYPELSKERVEA